MGFEADAELVLRKDGKVILDAILCSMLESIDRMGDVTAIAKSLGVPNGDLVGIIEAVNIQAVDRLVIVDGNDVSLTDMGRQAVLAYRLHEKTLREQMTNLWEKPWLTTDGVVLIDDKLVLIRRGNEPFKGMYALPGGILEYGETLEECVVREVKEETGLDTEVIGIAGAYSDPDRDPRGQFVTIAYNLRHLGGELQGGDDASGAFLFPLDQLPELAADHAKIIEDALKARKCVGP